MSRAEFQADQRTADAVERCLARISEAAVRLGTGADALVPGHPWNDIRGIGNVLRHAYHRVDGDVIWEVVTDDLPGLRDDIKAVLG